MEHMVYLFGVRNVAIFCIDLVKIYKKKSTNLRKNQRKVLSGSFLHLCLPKAQPFKIDRTKHRWSPSPRDSVPPILN